MSLNVVLTLPYFDVHFCLSFAVYNPPDPVPIVAGVLTTVIGIAILTYICIYRTATQEVQGNEFPAHSQDPATNAENPNYNVHIPQQL